MEQIMGKNLHNLSACVVYHLIDPQKKHSHYAFFDGHYFCKGFNACGRHFNIKPVKLITLF